MDILQQHIRTLYFGQSRLARRYRYMLIVFDALTIAYFVATAPLKPTPLTMGIDAVLGVLILLDLGARLWIAENRRMELSRIHTVADIIVVGSLLLAPLFADNLGFLRILRGLRLVRSYQLLHDLRREIPLFRLREDAILAAVNLFTFIFVTTSLVFVLAFDERAGVAGYVDALYFTVAALTTTGFGDIVMTTSGGKLLSVFIMIVGVALFFNLARAVVQPLKVRHKCPTCGLLRHDPDAVHCKHCGEGLKIETKGNPA